MLIVQKSGMFSSQYDISEDGSAWAGISMSGWRTRSEIKVAGQTFEARREGVWRPEYLLEKDGHGIASAEPFGFWSRSFEVHTGSGVLVLGREGWLTSAFVLKNGDSRLGRVERVSAWTSRFEAEFDKEIPVELQCFIIYVALMAWRQEEAGG